MDFKILEKRIRLYPPFPLNEKGEASGAFDKIWIPVGRNRVEFYGKISSSVPKGLIAQHKLDDDTFFCNGLRIDAEHGIPVTQVVNILLQQICQYTYQWWLRSGQALFKGMLRFGLLVGKDFEPAEELRYYGAGDVKSTWYAVNQTQKFIGIGNPPDSSLWLTIGSQVAKMRNAEAGLLAFQDALAAYRSNEDELCIFHLSLCVEILGNKRRILNNQKSVDAGKLIRTTDLVDGKGREILKELFIDRGHVAHGRPIHVLSKDYTIDKYIDAVEHLVSGCLEKLKPGQWTESTLFSVGKSGKRKAINEEKSDA